MTLETAEMHEKSTLQVEGGQQWGLERGKRRSRLDRVD
jgi:hypothetical protein